MIEGDDCGMSEAEIDSAMREIDYYMGDVRHFGEMSARRSIATMYYYTGETERRFGPYVDYGRVKELYEGVKDSIPDYNVWDFAVTLNLMYTEHADTVGRWTRGEDRLERRMTELAVGWLNDEVTNHLTDKIRWYMSCC